MNAAIGFLETSGIGIFAITLTCLLVYECLRVIWAVLPRMRIAPRLRVLVMIAPIYCVHIVNIWFFAGVFFIVENGTALGRIVHQSPAFQGHAPGWDYDTFLDCLYFSASTYTSLGFGDFLPRAAI